MPSSNIKRKKKPGLTNNGPSSNGGGGNYTETAMDEYLARLDLYRKPIAKDGSCLFRAVSEQVYNCQARHLQVRKDCIDFMRRNREKFEAFLEGPFDHHLFRLQNPKEWAGQVEISALSLMYKKDFIVYQAIDAEPTKVTDNNFKEKILLCFSNGNHYDAVYDIKFQKNAAVCQSLMYEILYQKVFTELDRKYNSKGPSQNQVGDVNSVMTNYYQNGLGEDDGFKDENEDNAGWTEVVRGRSNKAKSARQNRGYDQEEPKEEPMKPNLDQKHGWQAKRSLDNELYRNVELEVWEDSKNVQEQQDHSYAASIQYQPGDKCFAWLGQPDVADKVYEAIVKYYLPIQGNIEVKVPELGNKCFVIPLENLKPTENQQELNYRDLSGYYKKGEGPPGNNEGLRDDGKRGRRRNIPGRPGRGYKGDDQGEDTAARKGFQDESFGRPRGGGGPKFGGRGRGRGRYPRGGRDDRQMQREDEEARLIAEQAKLAELQGKDPAAFPALPTQQQQPEEKPPSTEAAPDQSPAEFWSRLKNTQGKPPVAPKENHVNTTENKPPSAPTSPTSQQANTAKLDEKELETKKERPLTKEARAPGAQNSEVVNKRAESKTPEAVNSVPLETSKKEQNEPQKQALPLEKELSKPNVEFSKGPNLNELKQPTTTVPTLAEVKSVHPKSNVEEVKFAADVVETRNAWAKEPTEKKDLKTKDKNPENNIKETVEPDLKKQEEPPSVKPQGVRGVIRMNNLNSKPQPTTETAEQEESPKDIKLLRKEDPVSKEIPNLKSALAGEGSSATPEKKTVTFAEPLKEGGEIKVLLSNAKDLAGKDGKREVIVPPTLVSVVMKPAPSSEIAQDKLTAMQTNKPEKNTNEDNTTTAKNSTPNQDTNTKPQVPTTTPSEITATQGTEGAEPVPSTSPSVSQHQPMYQLPFLTVMYMQLPNLTSTPRMPQNISMESDGSDLPEDPNTLRYFFNLGFQYHLHLSNQQWANQQMMYYPSVYQMPSQDHMQPHPAVSMGQQLNPGVPAQLIYQPQQMQAYHPAQIPPVMQENTSFSERNSVDRSSPGQTQQQQQQQTQQQQQQQQQPIPLHQTTPFVPNQHQSWRRPMTNYQGKQMHMGGYSNQVSNQQTPRGPMQQGASNTKAHYKTKKYPKHRNDQFMYGSQAQHAQNQGAAVHGAHAYSNTTQPAGSSSGAFYMPGGDHTAGKGSGDYYHSNQQYMNFHGNVPSSMTQVPHSAANSRGQYP